MRLTPRPKVSWISRTTSSSVFPARRPSREKPPVPSPATLTRRPVRPRVVYCICWLRRLRPLQLLKDGAAHHPILVLLRQERQLFREMRDAVLVAALLQRLGDIGLPMAALGPERLEHALKLHVHRAKGIGL